MKKTNEIGALHGKKQKEKKKVSCYVLSVKCASTLPTHRGALVLENGISNPSHWHFLRSLGFFFFLCNFK